MEDFFETLDTYHKLISEKKSLIINKAAFLDYYHYVSSLIENDVLFEAIVNNSFKIEIIDK